MEFACVASNVEIFWLRKEQTPRVSTQMEMRQAVLLNRMFPWQQLNQLMMWGSLTATNTVTGTRLSSCWGRSTQSTYRPVLFPRFTVPLSVQLPNSALWRTAEHFFYTPSEATCVNVCGPFEALLICSIGFSRPLMSEKSCIAMS